MVLMEVVWWLGGEAKRRAIRRGRALQFASPIESLTTKF